MASLALIGNYTYFGHTSAMLTRPLDWAAVPLCGVVGGLLGGLFSLVVVRVARGLPGAVGRFIARRPVAFAALCGLMIALAGLLSGGAVHGTGYGEAKRLLEGADGVPASFGALKFAATLLSTVSGIPGGIFSPSLATGAGLGADLARLLPDVAPGAVILLAMAAYFSGVVQAPITAFVIVLEMTDNNAMTMPVMAAALIGYGTSRLIGTPPVYHALAEGFLPRRAPAAGAGVPPAEPLS
jgi:H+/Cl- antiporter ClcA